MRWFAAMLATVTVAFAGGVARADDTGKRTDSTSPSRNSQVNKQLAFVDVYISGAMTNAKALSTLADAEQGKSDNAMIGEGRKNIDMSIDRALAHVKELRAMKDQLRMTGTPSTGGSTTGSAAAATGDATARLDELNQHLTDAKSAAKKLNGAKIDDLASCVDGVSTHIMAAQQSFRDLARATSYTLLEDQNLGTVPVRGGLPSGNEIQRDLDKDKGDHSGMSPGAMPPTGNTPSSTPPSTTPNATPPSPAGAPPTTPPSPPSKTEPTEKAPPSDQPK